MQLHQRPQEGLLGEEDVVDAGIHVGCQGQVEHRDEGLLDAGRPLRQRVAVDRRRDPLED